MEKIENVTKFVKRDRDTVEDIKQYQSRTDRRLNSLENKTCIYNVVTSNLTSLDRIQATLNETRNVLLSCTSNGTKADEILVRGKAKRNFLGLFLG